MAQVPAGNETSGGPPNDPKKPGGPEGKEELKVTALIEAIKHLPLLLETTQQLLKQIGLTSAMPDHESGILEKTNQALVSVTQDYTTAMLNLEIFMAKQEKELELGEDAISDAQFVITAMDERIGYILTQQEQEVKKWHRIGAQKYINALAIGKLKKYMLWLGEVQKFKEKLAERGGKFFDEIDNCETKLEVLYYFVRQFNTLEGELGEGLLAGTKSELRSDFMSRDSEALKFKYQGIVANIKLANEGNEKKERPVNPRKEHERTKARNDYDAIFGEVDITPALFSISRPEPNPKYPLEEKAFLTALYNLTNVYIGILHKLRHTPTLKGGTAKHVEKLYYDYDLIGEKIDEVLGLQDKALRDGRDYKHGPIKWFKMQFAEVFKSLKSETLKGPQELTQAETISRYYIDKIIKLKAKMPSGTEMYIKWIKEAFEKHEEGSIDVNKLERECKSTLKYAIELRDSEPVRF
jgi:hypothetical protein